MDSALYTDALLESAIAGLIAFNLQGEICFANQVAQNILSQETDKPLTISCPELLTLASETALSTQKNRIHSLHLGGSDYSVTVQPVTEQEKLLGYACSIYAHAEIESLTRNTKAFQDLYREESAIINSSPDGLWICDADATVVRINPASERLNNVRATDVIGKHMEELVAEGIFDKSVTLEVIKNKKRVSLLQKRGERSLFLTGEPVFDLRGKLIRVVVGERDVTEIHNLQTALEDQEALKNRYMEQVASLQKVQSGNREIIARSPEFINVITQAIKVSTVDSTVLIFGESGVGKGLIADLIHENSKRKNKPIIKLNCGAIPETLVESELFGHEKGAFTGAHASKAGQFELANEGILFLDEVAELPLSAQVKLLRFLEDGCITRLGSNQKKEVDVRVLAATHRNLEVMVKDGSFRLDLYYRLKVIPLHIPPLRERRACILPLLHHHLAYFSTKVGSEKRLSPEASDILTRYDYPGNVRELINLCERLVVMTDSALIGAQDLPREVKDSVGGGDLKIMKWSKERTLADVMDEVEERIYNVAFAQYHNQYKVAAALGVSQATVARRLKKYGILLTLADNEQA